MPPAAMSSPSNRLGSQVQPPKHPAETGSVLECPSERMSFPHVHISKPSSSLLTNRLIYAPSDEFLVIHCSQFITKPLLDVLQPLFTPKELRLRPAQQECDAVPEMNLI